jgi:hypothetical protein
MMAPYWVDAGGAPAGSAGVPLCLMPGPPSMGSHLPSFVKPCHLPVCGSCLTSVYLAATSDGMFGSGVSLMVPSGIV